MAWWIVDADKPIPAASARTFFRFTKGIDLMRSESFSLFLRPERPRLWAITSMQTLPSALESIARFQMHETVAHVTPNVTRDISCWSPLTQVSRYSTNARRSSAVRLGFIFRLEGDSISGCTRMALLWASSRQFMWTALSTTISSWTCKIGTQDNLKAKRFTHTQCLDHELQLSRSSHDLPRYSLAHSHFQPLKLASLNYGTPPDHIIVIQGDVSAFYISDERSTCSIRSTHSSQFCFSAAPNFGWKAHCDSKPVTVLNPALK